MQKLGDFKLPHFFNYPPYFTLQPVRDTARSKFNFGRNLFSTIAEHKRYLSLDSKRNFLYLQIPSLRCDCAATGSLSHEAREAFISALVSDGRAEWLDKGHRKCLILWHRIQDWADIILHFVKNNGLEDSVMTVDEMRSGVESRGTELQGIDRTILMRALKLLEQKGKLAIFKGSSTDDEGIKFSV